MLAGTLAKRYRLAPEDMADMTLEQIEALIPELTLNHQAQMDDYNKRIGLATEKWVKDHPGKKPDLFNDIIPSLGAVHA